jgi:hypothetical protein
MGHVTTQRQRVENAIVHGDDINKMIRCAQCWFNTRIDIIIITNGDTIRQLHVSSIHQKKKNEIQRTHCDVHDGGVRTQHRPHPQHGKHG